MGTMTVTERPVLLIGWAAGKRLSAPLLRWPQLITALNTFARGDLPTLSNKLKEVVQELNAINYSKAFSRSGYIGIGQNGINSAYVSMKDLICDLLLDVADDTNDMAYCLEQFLSDVNLTEEQSAAALRAAGQDNGRDTWRSLERVTSRHNLHLQEKGAF